MKRTFTYALATVLASAFVAPAFGQDNFPDVPDNHWAYEALLRLKKEGVLVGYPDGLFRGPRPASRYEIAVAINAAYTNLKNITDGLNTQIAELKTRIADGGNAAQLQQLRDALTALQSEVNTLKGVKDDVANLRRLADTFQRELQQLGVDVEAIKRDLGDIADRVTKLEQKKPAVNISGDVNLFVAAGNAYNDYYSLDKDGRINGTTQPANPNFASGGRPAGLTRDLSILHEGAFTFSGTNDTGPQWKGTLVVGNMLGSAGNGFGNQSTLQAGTGYGEGASDVYLQDFSVKFTTALAGLGFNAEVGRVGYKVSPYAFQRIDNTSYFENERWDNGKYTFDGAILGFNLGGAKVDVFGGRNSNRFSTNGVEINPTSTGTIGGSFGFTGGAIDRSLGVNVNVPLTSAGNLNLSYLWLESNNYFGAATPTPTAANTANRDNVFGGTANFNVGRIKLEGGFYQSDLTANEDRIIDKDNTTWFAGAAYSTSKLGLYAKYREIEGNYAAPGDWGRLGVLRNPTNIKGVQVGGNYNVTSGIALKATGEFYKGLDNAFAGTSGFGEGTDITKYTVDLSYKVNSNLSLYAGYEDNFFDSLVNPNTKNGALGRVFNPRYQWYTLGLGYGLSDAAKLTLQYQVSEINNEYQVTSNNQTRYRGGLLTTQLSVKF